MTLELVKGQLLALHLGRRKDAGTLVPRGRPGAVIHDHDKLVGHVLRMLDAGGVVSQSGKVLPGAMDSICVHGDNAESVATARTLREGLEKAGYRMASIPEVYSVSC